jgi:hypothetical protein
MDTEIFDVLKKWATLESRLYGTEVDVEAGELSSELSSIETNILQLRPVSKVGALAQLRFAIVRLERSGDDGLLSSALRHVLHTLSRA